MERGQRYKVAHGLRIRPMGKFHLVKSQHSQSCIHLLDFHSGETAHKSKIGQIPSPQVVECHLCSATEEDDAHLVFTCFFARKVWEELRKWWAGIPIAVNKTQMLSMIKHTKEPKTRKLITGAIMTAAIYNIWRARNPAMFKNQILPVTHIVKGIREQIKYRILYLYSIHRKFEMYIDSLLH
ncbi:hypothetical protein Cgig2_033519 [Carnegiea gigantea]|uniref:Reverse transcriptase zinc-binding domain-containing protein n=1 Tax=Carnegiea gigantea TaxID=171969 RepID=A0A9Q1GKH4_9CARY|nr:hypothetical protein Cgig2_033519 [Carnegiea gigantea]